MRRSSIPNFITFARLLLNIPLLIAFGGENYLACLFIYLGQELLDQIDGKLAKHFGWESRSGAFFDPFVDSTTHLIGFSCFLSLGWLPVWMFAALLFRELGLSFLRLIGSFEGVQVAGRWPGKVKALVHALSLAIAWSSLAQFISFPRCILPAFFASTLVSLLSGAVYLYGYRGVLRKAFA